MADAQPLYMAVEDKAAALVELARVEAQLAELNCGCWRRLMMWLPARCT